MSPRDRRAGARRERRGSDGPQDGGRGPTEAGGQVSDVQRIRVLAAATEVVAELGYAGMTVGRIIARARVSRRTFYELYEDREDCFLAAFDQAVARVAATVGPAYEREARWRDRVRGALAALLALFDAEPALARLCVVEALAAGPRALERRARVLAGLIDAVDAGRAERAAHKQTRPGSERSRVTAEGVVGAVLAVIHARLLAPDREAPLLDLLPALMSMIALPYLGAAAAERELARPAPASTSRSARELSGGLPKDLNMRMTYRTLRVLAAIAARPGASNRGVAEGAGMGDQGQTSKLLSRLQRLGLVRNDGAGHAKGEANAWALTAEGRQIVEAIEPVQRR